MSRPPGLPSLLFAIVGWLIAAATAALAATVAVAFIAGFVPTFLGNLGLALTVPAPDELVYVLAGIAAFEATLLLGAIWMGRRADRTNRYAGLTIGPVPRFGLILRLWLPLLAWAVIVVTVTAMVPAVRDFVLGATPDSLRPTATPGAAILVPGVLLIAVLAPLAEETFFRGWLWDALVRRGFGVTATAVITAVPWLALHALEAPNRVLFLIPAAVAFSIGRHQGGVRTSLLVHMANNAAALALMSLPRVIAAG